MKVRLTRLADSDIATALRQTRRLFGTQQVLHYADLIQAGLDLIAVAPDRPSSLRRDEIAQGLRSFHLELVRKRRGSAAHILFYRVQAAEDEGPEVVILRLLHERMELGAKLSRALRDEADRE